MARTQRDSQRVGGPLSGVLSFSTAFSSLEAHSAYFLADRRLGPPMRPGLVRLRLVAAIPLEMLIKMQKHCVCRHVPISFSPMQRERLKRLVLAASIRGGSSCASEIRL